MLLQKINQNIEHFIQNSNTISKERKEKLHQLSDAIYKKIIQNQTVKLIVICTHNSRRSHIGQLWLAAGASYFKLPQTETYSGGTEITAFHPNAIKAMQHLGFEITTKNQSNSNPVYSIQWKESQIPYEAFSKHFKDFPNPSEHFLAIIVCSEADKGCPFVPGTDFKIVIPFEDPKLFDDTLLESEKYLAHAKQMGTEMIYVLSTLKKKLK